MEIYEGTKPYLFISYAHKNASEVAPIIELLVKRGFRVWYDSGLEVGTEWPALISSHLKSSEVMLAFITDDYVNSKNCRNEVNLAMNKGKTVLAVYLKENVELTGGMDLQLASVHCVFRTRHSSDNSLVDELVKSKLLSNCKDNNASNNTVIVSETVKRYSDTFDFKKVKGGFSVALKTGAKLSSVLVIPSQTDDNQQVVEIAENGFASLQGVSDVYLGEGVTKIGVNAFSGASIKEISLPSSLKQISRGAFENCGYLTEIELNEGLEYIGDIAFENAGVRNVILPSTVKNIGENAFKSSGVVYLESKGAIDRIGKQAFAYCSYLYKVILPFACNDRGEDVFLGCNLISEVKSAYYNCYGIPYNSSVIKKVTYTYTSGKTAITYDNLHLNTPVVVSAAFKTAGVEFAYKPILNTLIISEGVEKITKTLLNVENLVLPTSFKKDGKYLFDGNGAPNYLYYEGSKEEYVKNFKTPPIGRLGTYFKGEWTYVEGVPVRNDSVNLVKKELEKKNKKLTPSSVITKEFDPEKYPYLNYYYNENADVVFIKETDAFLPENMVIPPCTINGCENVILSLDAFDLTVKTVEVAGNVSIIMSGAFSNYTELESVKINEGVQFVFGSAFSFCSCLTEIKTPNSLIGFLDWVGNCKSLKHLKIPSGYFCDGIIASGCNNLKSVILPNNVKFFDQFDISIDYTKNLSPSTLYKCNNVTYIGFNDGETLGNEKAKLHLSEVTNTLTVNDNNLHITPLVNYFANKVENLFVFGYFTYLSRLNIEKFKYLKNIVGSYGVALKFKTLNNVNMFVTKSSVAIKPENIVGYKNVYLYGEWKYEKIEDSYVPVPLK